MNGQRDQRRHGGSESECHTAASLQAMWDDADDWHTKRAAITLAIEALYACSRVGGSELQNPTTNHMRGQQT